MQPSDELQDLAIESINGTSSSDIGYVLVYIDDIIRITNEPFEDKLEQLNAAFQQLRLNAQELSNAKAAWTQADYWIAHGRSPFTARNAQGTRQISERELIGFGKMSKYLKTMGMQCLPLLSPMAMVPSNQSPQDDRSNALAISRKARTNVNSKARITYGTETPREINQWEGRRQKRTANQPVTLETMADAMNQQELMLVMTDANPYIVGSVVVSKGKPVIAHSCNLTGQPRRTTTKNEMLFILAKLREQPEVIKQHTVLMCTDNRSVRYGCLNTTSRNPWELILKRDKVILTYLSTSETDAADEISRQERQPLLLDPHSTA
jgi:hypothetical protein